MLAKALIHDLYRCEPFKRNAAMAELPCIFEQDSQSQLARASMLASIHKVPKLQ